MTYKGIRVNEYSKAYACPHCENETPAKGDFCQICGSDIVNHCCDTFDIDTGKIIKSCGNTLSGDARYCPKCGNEGNFFQKGWLSDWKGENVKQAIRNLRSTSQTPVPFGNLIKDDKKKDLKESKEAT